MERNGKTLKAAPQKRRMADGKNAWRKMTPEQRGEFLSWIVDSQPEDVTGDEPLADFAYGMNVFLNTFYQAAGS